MSVNPKRLRISHTSKVSGQVGKTRKDCEKNCPARMKQNDRLLSEKGSVLSILMTEIVKGIVGPKGEVTTEYVIPVSKRKSMYLSSTRNVTLDSEDEGVQV